MPQGNAVTHDLYTATISVNLPPDSEMRKGVESSMKLLPPSFKCKAVYVRAIYSNHLPLLIAFIPV